LRRYLGKIEPVHEGDDLVVGGQNVLVGEVPVGGVLEGVLVYGCRNSGHFAQADPTPHADDAGEKHRAGDWSGVLLAQMRQAVRKAGRAIDRAEDFG